MADQQFPYDIFISYAHKDDHDGWVEGFVDALVEEHARFTPTPLQLFFDRQEIEAMDDWEHRILRGLRGSKVMLAVLSPHYFNSAYCRKEWEIYLDHELDRAMTGQGIAPIYIASAPLFEDEAKAALDDWIVNLRRRQYLDVREWRSQGHQMLQNEDVRRRLESLEQNLAESLSLSERITSSPTNVPAHNRNFVGRLDELRRLREVLALTRVGSVAVVQGLGGMGKSALAFEYSHAYAGEYPGGRFLVSAAGVDDLRVPMVNLADQKGVPLSEEERKDLAGAFARVRAAFEKGPRSLLVLDDVDNAALLSPKARATWLPTGDSVHVMATTTLGLDPQAGLEILPLNALSERDALALLERHRAFDTDEEEAAAKRIVERLGAHALAVEVVGVYLWQTPDVNYEGYLSRLEAEGLEAIEGVVRDENIELSRHQQPMLSALMEPTIARLKPAEAAALEYGALLPHDYVALPWLRALAGRSAPELKAAPKPGYPDPWRQIERRLMGLRLLMPGEDGHMARMQRLVQDVVAARVEETERGECWDALVAHALERGAWIQANWTTREGRWEIQPLLHFALRLLENGDGENGPVLANRVSDALLQLGRYDEGANLLRRALAVEETKADDIVLAESCSNLSLVEQAWGHNAEARALLKRALDVWEKAPNSGPDLAMGLSNLALVEQEDNQLPRARELLLRAIGIEEAMLGAEHSNLATSLSNLATVERELGNLGEARDLLVRAAAIDEKASGTEHPNLGVRFANLAGVEQAMGHLGAARDWMKKAVALFEAILDAEHPYLAVVYSSLANIERELGHPDVARELLKKAIASEEKALSARHPNLAVRYSNLALAEQDLGNLDEAKALLERAVALLEGLGEAGRPNLAAAFSNMALVERDRGELARAHELLSRAVAMDEEIFGVGHSNTAISYAKLATVERALGHVERARELLVKAIAVQREALGEQHPRLAMSEFWLSQVEFDGGNGEEARRWAGLAYATQSALLPESHPDTRRSAEWMAKNGWG